MRARLNEAIPTRLGDQRAAADCSSTVVSYAIITGVQVGYVPA